MCMFTAAWLLVSLTGWQLAGIRVPNLEGRPSPRDWSAYERSGRPVFTGNFTGHLTNDGQYLLGWTEFKTLEVFDIKNGKTEEFENVFGSRMKDGKFVFLTDSQAGRVKGQLSFPMEGPFGAVLAASGNTYVVAIRGKGQALSVGEIDPKKRDLDSN